MNHQTKNLVFILFTVILVQFWHSCKNETTPFLTTFNITDITFTTAISGGIISSDGGSPITEKGVCWSTNENPTVKDDRTMDGAGTGNFTSDIVCLSFATTYYVRAYATNSAGTAYGNQQSFTTPGNNPIIFNPDLEYGSVTDIEGNCYKTIEISGHTWMAENLRTSRYTDGSPIPKVNEKEVWSNLGQGWPPFDIADAYCWYNNDSAAYEHIYGKLYNFGVVKTGKLCPTGWHVPESTEMRVFNNEQNCETFTDLGWELMEAGDNHWTSAAQCRNNITGFTALPGGLRSEFGDFRGIGNVAMFWSSTPEGGFYLVYANKIPHEIYYFQISDVCSQKKGAGLSVRCIKD